MAKKNNRKWQRIVTPVGEALYPRVNKPDTKFKDQGEYSTKLIVEPDACWKRKDESTAEDFFAHVAGLIDEYRESVLAKAQEDAKSAKGAAKRKANQKLAKLKKFDTKYPWEPELDDEGEETGNQVLISRCNASFKGRDDEVVEVEVPVFDASNNEIDVMLASGSKIRVSADLVFFTNPSASQIGGSLRLKKVKVLELVEYKPGQGADEFEDEDGYTYEDEDDDSDFEDEGDDAPLDDVDDDADTEGDGDF